MEEQVMCKYCENHSTASVPVRGNCNPVSEGFISLIADTGNGGKSLVIHHDVAFEIPLNYCPFCGEKIKGNESYIENYTDEVWYEKLVLQRK